MTGPAGEFPDDRQESPLRRADRNMIELLQELRVAQTGVQILFAFLLSLAFTGRFAALDEIQRGIYLATLLLSVVTTGLLIAPAAAHRRTFGRGRKAETVALGQTLFTLGLGTLALTLTGAVLLVLDVVAGRTFGVVVGAVTLLVLGTLWFVLPLRLLRGPAG